MNASPDTLIDGNWIQPDTTGAPRFVYPFRMNGDKVSCYFEQDYLQLMASRSLPFYPSPLSIPHPSLKDFYLIKETDPQFGIANLLSLTRTFSRIPTTQITFSSQAITKPSPGSFGIGSQIYNINTTGTYVSTGLLFFLYSGYYFLNNQVYVIQVAATSANSGGNTRISATAHGITGSETILFTNNLAGVGGYIVAPAYYTVVDANTIDLIGINIGVTSGGYISKYYRAYTPGTDRVGTRLSQTFYLPGVTTGITTPADIPIPDPLLNDLALVNSMLAHLTGYQTYDSTALVQWMGSPIYTQTAIEINMADL